MKSETQQVKTILFSGSLARRFGRSHKMAVSTLGEAIYGMTQINKKFSVYMRSRLGGNQRFAVFVDGVNVVFDKNKDISVSREIRIVPQMIGRKNGGVLQTIMGAVLIVVGAVLYAYGGQAAMSAGIGLMASGAASAIGGVIQMLSPQQGGLKLSEDPDNKPSYAFGGAVNTTSAGYPMPIPIGKRAIGGAILSAGIYSEDLM